MRCILTLAAAFGLLAQSAIAAPTFVTTHGAESTSLDGEVAVDDLLAGLIATELSDDAGWHPANPAAGNGSLDPFGLPTFTDDVGRGGAPGGLAGLLNDFSTPAKSIQYDLASASNIQRIQILTGNDGKDGRVFSTTVVSFSTDNGANFTELGYFQSDASGTINGGQWGSTLVNIFDDAGAPLVEDATNLMFQFFAVDNTGGELRDPFDGVNPYTNLDDGFNAAIAAPLVWEIDAIVPEPATGTLLAGSLLAFAMRRRR